MSIIEIKVTLEVIEPAVSRTLKVPLDIRLDRLHLVIQAAMGWENYHLYEFMVGNTRWGLPDPDFDDEALLAAKARLVDVIEAAGRSPIRYIYDFGDNWEHKIIIGKISDPVSGEVYPRLNEVTGKCPPEDVGGFPGYEMFLDAMVDPKHSEHEHLKEWYGANFDPNAPDTDELKLEVLKLAKHWKPHKPKK